MLKTGLVLTKYFMDIIFVNGNCFTCGKIRYGSNCSLFQFFFVMQMAQQNYLQYNYKRRTSRLFLLQNSRSVQQTSVFWTAVKNIHARKLVENYKLHQ